VEKTFGDMASARILTDWTKDQIRESDSVATRLEGMPPPGSNEARPQQNRSPRWLAAQRLLGVAVEGVEGQARRETEAEPPEREPAFVELTPEQAGALDAGADAERSQSTTTEPGPQVDAPAEVDEPVAAPPVDDDAPPPPVNPFVLTAKDRLSTFAMDVDTASFDIALNYVARGALPPRRLVRMEEFVNAFDYHYPRQSRDAFSVHVEGMPSPFGRGVALLKIGVQAKVLGREGRKPAHLVFVVDTSGSMDRPDRLPLVVESLELLLGELGERDTVSLVTYGSQPRILLENAPAAERARVASALRSMRCTGSTNLCDGLEVGYQIAHRQFRARAVNRIVLCSDGVANVGESRAEEILQQVTRYRRWGITLTTVGFGAGSYDDRMLERLANSGDGNYLFVDSPAAARRAFVENLSATIQVVAFDAKIQVEFDPRMVRRYRLIGYENRDVADEDFRNDAVDAGEVGSGQSVTALYEIELEAGAPRDAALGSVYVRYRDADSRRIEEIARSLPASAITRCTSAERPRLHLAACAAEVAEILRGSEHAEGGSMRAVVRALDRVVAALPLDGRAGALRYLAARAAQLRSER
jgi:Ca-activated chloride channel family protein